MKSKDFIEELKKQHKLPSNYAAARMLDMTDQRISAYMRGRREFDDATAIKIAELLDYPEGFVLASIQAERQTDRSLSKVWRNVAAGILESAKGKAHAVGLALLLGITAMSNPQPAQASIDAAQGDHFSGNDLYIMRIY